MVNLKEMVHLSEW